MRQILLSILFIGNLSFTAEKPVHEKLLEKHVGNWETSIEGKLSINGNVANQLKISGRRQAKAIFGGKVISSLYNLKGKNFEGTKTDVEGIGFLFWDGDKKKLRMIEFMSDGMAFATLFDVEDESHYKTVFKEEAGVKSKSGIGFSEDGKEMMSFMTNETIEYGAVSEMKWTSKKAEDKDYKVEHKPSEKINEKFIRYKTDEYKWILGGKFLYREGKDKKGSFISIIGNMAGQTGKKFKIFEDGSFKAYRPKSAHIWDEVKIKD